MRVFPETNVFTTKPRIDAYILFTSKRDLVVRTIAIGETRISAIGLIGLIRIDYDWLESFRIDSF